MIGTWRWNVAFGICGSLLTLMFSLGSNGLPVTSLRSLYAFIAFFVLMYLFRAVFALILNAGGNAATDHPEPQDEARGSQVDMSTPDQSDELNDLLKKQMDGNVQLEPGEQLSFQPLTPPKLVSTPNKEPEELAKAVRHLTGG
ncbi:hypothetical protein PAECIP111893_00986 [Paenibacillus plantiphilus]|uniref:Uncharacterized protein n=1 Tax=Paenibacillus plantiphilus TaxID=2905650 RepID=A0ABM9BYG2_9BACL|nr:hypothetical protein [Paenibacillus plantiphilus]CAH1197804.1 hypothetical protein PAECIP111893_00986 [Paenibacillus plantiphilus]